MARTVLSRINYRIARSKTSVFLRADFSDIGRYGQVGLSLKKLVSEKKLIKIGHGVYARAS